MAALTTTGLKEWFKTTGFFHSHFYRYLMFPVAERLLYTAKTRFGPRKSPLTRVSDVRALAAQRGWAVQAWPGVIQEREASHTIAEDMLDMIRRGSRRVSKMHETMLHLPRARHRGEMYYSHLYSKTRYPVGETFTCAIPQAQIVSPTGAVLTAQGEVLTQSTFDSLAGANMPIVPVGAVRPPVLPGTYVSLIATMWTSNYSHWFMDSLVRLALLDPERTDYKVILPFAARPYHYDALRLLGIDADRIVTFQAKHQRIAVETLLLCVAAERGAVPNRHYLHTIRDQLVVAATGRTHHPNPTRRLYISRARSARKIVNEAVLYPVLHEYGFEVVFCEDLTLEEQIRLFSEATVVVGAHGAGMINPIFCNPGAVVIEIYNRQRWNHCICRVMNLMGHRHWHIFGEDVGGNWDTAVDPSRLRKALRYSIADAVSDATLYDEPY